MCGIFGFIRKKSTSIVLDRDLASYVEQAMLVGTLRGRDAFGCFAVNNNNREEVSTFKVNASAATLFETPVRASLKDVALMSQVFIGHHRATTIGGMKQAAAHPHTVVGSQRTVTGVHNGTLTGYSLTNHVSDSHWLYQQIADKGSEALNTITGAFALVWVQSDDPDHIYLAKNHERPLWWAKLKGDTGYVLASEYKMMDWLLDRIQIKTDTVDRYTYIPLEDDVVFKINLDTMELIKVHEIKKPQPAATVTNISRGSPYWDESGTSTTSYINQQNRYICAPYIRYVPSLVSEQEILDAENMNVLGEYKFFVVKKRKVDKEGRFRLSLIEADDDGIEEAFGFPALCRNVVGPYRDVLNEEGEWVVRCEIIGLEHNKDGMRLFVGPPVCVFDAKELANVTTVE